MNKMGFRKNAVMNTGSYTGQSVYYAVVCRNVGTDGVYALVDPPAVWKSRNLAEENLFFHQAEKGDSNLYGIRKCVLDRAGGGHVVKELFSNNKIGPVLYKGKVKIYY